jgi:hypothetical protein
MAAKPDNPRFVIHEAIKVLRQAKQTSIERPLKVKMLIDNALEILESYDQRE